MPWVFYYHHFFWPIFFIICRRARRGYLTRQRKTPNEIKNLKQNCGRFVAEACFEHGLRTIEEVLVNIGLGVRAAADRAVEPKKVVERFKQYTSWVDKNDEVVLTSVSFK